MSRASSALRPATIRQYLEAIREKRLVAAATELTYREPLADFLRQAATELGFGTITINAELSLQLIGKPDFQVANPDGAPIGYGETKTPGTAADHEKVLRGEQVDRYRRNLGTVLVTDYLRFTLYRNGAGRVDVSLLDSPARLTSGPLRVHPVQADQLGQLLTWFFSARAPTATTAEQLADGLARRTALLRASIRALLNPADTQGEQLRTLHGFYRETLMSDMSADDFADTYAQTLMFSLFLSRLEGGPQTDVSAAWQAIPEDVPILRSAVQPLLIPGQPLPLEMRWVLEDALHLLAGTPDGVIDAIGHPAAGSPDPILYFYEHFLAAYDHAERISKGVYYTPRPLVDYLVRAVDDTLKGAFGLPAGLAEKGVSLLDPAVGTGTFPLAAAQRAVANVASMPGLGAGAIPSVLQDRVLPNFAGLELLPAPYTIAHVKFSLFAKEQGVSFKDHRARIYLTNTLGDPLEKATIGGMLSMFVGGLIDEAREAERLKHEEQILVVIGNPPYSATSHNKQPEIERIFAEWKKVDGKPIEDAVIALNDDYLKFMRWALWKLFEQESSPRYGILAFVTNHAFVTGRIHRGVRKALLERFDDLYVFNLQGNQRQWVKGVKDEKVFPDVQQGIALSVFVRQRTSHGPAGRVHYREMRGTRQEKYAAAANATLVDTDWERIEPAGPYYSFAPSDADLRYDSWPTVPDILPLNSSGVQSSRDKLVSDVDTQPLLQRMQLVADPSRSDEALKEEFDVRENPRWKWAEHRKALAPYDPRRAVTWLYRLFDRRYIYWDPALVQWPRQRVMRHLLPTPLGLGGHDRLALVVQRAGPKPTGAIASMARGVACAHVTSQWCHVYPLRLAPKPADGGWLPISEADWRENISAAWRQTLTSRYGHVSIEQVAWYMFAVLSAPSYLDRFSASLAMDHPRVPFPADPQLFDAMVGLGERLGRLHLLEVPPPTGASRLHGAGSAVVNAIRYEPTTESVWINTTQRFAPVSEAAWQWGRGFRPLEHFLQDRKDRQLDAEQIDMFCRAVLAVEETLAVADALDVAFEEVIQDVLDPDMPEDDEDHDDWDDADPDDDDSPQE